MTIVRVTEDSTREEIAEAITHLAAKASRLPTHFVDKRAEIHAAIDDLLYQLQARPVTSADATATVGA